MASTTLMMQLKICGILMISIALVFDEALSKDTMKCIARRPKSSIT
jgi:hypothetical protein